MTSSDTKSFAVELKRILENVEAPERLDDHLWARSLTVEQWAANGPAPKQQGPGRQLLSTLTELFFETMPSTPPRRGKRLDTHWGQFGILAAQYFAPLEFGAVHPTSLRDAWGRIDQAIPLFVHGKPGNELSPAEHARYQLIDDEVETAPTSTLSDWHVKGLERLAQSFLNREQHLSSQLGKRSILLNSGGGGESDAAFGGLDIDAGAPQWWLQIGTLYKRHTRRFWLALALLVLLLAGWKVGRVTWLARSVWAELAQLQALASSEPDLALLDSTGAMLSTTREDVTTLRAEVRPFLWIGRGLAWVPVYGPDLAAAGALLELTEGVVIAADEALQGAAPIGRMLQAAGARPAPPEILALLVQSQPDFAVARQSLAQAQAARAQFEPEHLIPRVRAKIEQLDTYLPLLEDGLAAVAAAPRLLGAPDFGPQTYLVLLQNEDELRATGGFITAVGTLTVEDGEVIAFTLEDSYAIDDLTKPYLPAPWQLDRYMYSHILLMRDSNWSPDFPSAATWAEHLYVYSRAHAVDGVIAVDQEAIRLLLAGIGPVDVEGAPQPVTADNVIGYIRAAKAPAEGAALDREWWQQRKEFMRPLAVALQAKLQGDAELAWEDLCPLGVTSPRRTPRVDPDGRSYGRCGPGQPGLGWRAATRCGRLPDGGRYEHRLQQSQCRRRDGNYL